MPWIVTEKSTPEELLAVAPIRNGAIEPKLLPDSVIDE